MPKVRLSTLIKDYSVYPRHQIDDYHIREMVRSLEAGDTLPDILVDRASKRIVDGFHRASAWERYSEEDDPLVPVKYADYASEGALFVAAANLNSGHGRTLTSMDKTRCIVLAESLGIDPTMISGALRITTIRAEELRRTRVSADGEVLKRTLTHLAGEQTTLAQREYNDHAAGPDQLFLLRQVTRLITSGSLDLKRDTVRAAVEELDTALTSIKASI